MGDLRKTLMGRGGWDVRFGESSFPKPLGRIEYNRSQALSSSNKSER